MAYKEIANRVGKNPSILDEVKTILDNIEDLRLDKSAQGEDTSIYPLPNLAKFDILFMSKQKAAAYIYFKVIYCLEEKGYQVQFIPKTGDKEAMLRIKWHSRDDEHTDKAICTYLDDHVKPISKNEKDFIDEYNKIGKAV